MTTERAQKLDETLTRLEVTTAMTWVFSIILMLIIALFKAFLPSDYKVLMDTAMDLTANFMMATMTAFGVLYFVRIFLTGSGEK